MKQDLGKQLAPIASMQALRSAWRKVKRNKGAAGRDGMTVAAFSRSAGRGLRALRKELLEGAYRPGLPLRIEIPKKSGGSRQLSIPSVRDRIVQTALTALLSGRLEPWMSDDSYGYRPGRSTADAAARVLVHRIRGYRWVVDADIEQFFDAVPHEVILKLLEPHVPEPALMALVSQTLSALASGATAEGGVGLAQGSPLSPLLANVALTPIDRGMASKRIKLVRYADDLLLLARSRREAEDAAERLEDLLAASGLRLNAAKSRVTSFRAGFDFLGFAFVGACVKEGELEMV